jgi:hypothetical protein
VGVKKMKKKHVGKIIRFLFKNPESRFGVAIFALFDNEKKEQWSLVGTLRPLIREKWLKSKVKSVVDTSKNRKKHFKLRRTNNTSQVIANT